jgi:hypothetical protein
MSSKRRGSHVEASVSPSLKVLLKGDTKTNRNTNFPTSVLNIIKKLIESKYSAWRSDSAWETKFNSFLTELDEKFGEQGKSCAALIRQAMVGFI